MGIKEPTLETKRASAVGGGLIMKLVLGGWGEMGRWRDHFIEEKEKAFSSGPTH